MANDLLEAPVISKETQKTYLRRRQEEIKKCEHALASGEWDTLERVGHKLKGSAETFGYPQLSDLGTLLEDRAQKRDPNEVKKLLSQFGKFVAESLDSFGKSEP